MARVPFEYWRPDEVAECVDGVGEDLYKALWDLVSDYESKSPPFPGEIGPDTMGKFFRRLSLEHKQRLRDLEKIHDAKNGGD